MLTLVYRGILAFMAVLVVRCLFRERSFWKQVTAAMVLVPMVLRILMIK